MATTLRLTWTPNPSAELVTAYEVYERIGNAGMALKTTVSAPLYEIIDPVPGVYQWQLKAKNVAGVSGMSAVINGPQIPSSPTGGTVDVVVS